MGQRVETKRSLPLSDQDEDPYFYSFGKNEKEGFLSASSSNEDATKMNHLSLNEENEAMVYWNEKTLIPSISTAMGRWSRWRVESTERDK
jgi:hypothetical protein